MISPLQDEECLSMLPPKVSVSCSHVPVHISPVLLWFISPHFSLPLSVSFATYGRPNCQCCTPSIYVFNYFHNVHNFSLIPHSIVSFSVFIRDVEHVSFHVVLCCRQFLFHFCCSCPGLCSICHCWKDTLVEDLSL